ncbi:zinc ABC transporter ATP-binding protein AztA [Nocardiopsis flavescens]|uniref:Zinc/manganese transport system ATP-binding protein n=1 Tax=Nocardiopsis flavescens TaxID=758803 RepID=A0A1M6JNG9_9ACTN|nr:zinc ABC transporter ATP-binding protein AztA [Nocardiopsis flavescens]SHJ48178.1 zinc/manganese transport system ATP-binding protein [Nocardiopsis flavescens]
MTADPARAAQGQAPVIELADVRAGYRDRDVLHGAALALHAGTVTALVGANGSGKSTLLAVMAGVLAPRSGTVTLGTPRRPALVVQRSAASDALPLTAREAVAMGRWGLLGPWRRPTRRDRAAVGECMDRLGVADLARRRLGELSGGQRQRVLLAQGLAQEADLLLLDEPSTGLDADSRERIAAVLDQERGRGAAVVHATHSRGEADRADRVLVMEGGRPVAGEAPVKEPLS